MACAPALLALVSALVGCAYQPGSFAPEAEFPGQRASVGCLDVAVERRADLPIGPVLGYRFANRCDRAATIDLAAATVIGRSANAPDTVLRPYDPRGELRPLAIDGRSIGGEALAYPAGRAIAQVCVDAATLTHQGSARWLCFGGVPGTAPASAASLQARSETSSVGGSGAEASRAETRDAEALVGSGVETSRAETRDAEALVGSSGVETSRAEARAAEALVGSSGTETSRAEARAAEVLSAGASGAQASREEASR